MRRAIALIMLASCSMAAVAQIPSSTSDVYDNAGKDKFRLGAIELRRLAGCEIRKSPGYARNMLESVPDSDTESSLGSIILKVMENCMRDNIPAMRIGFGPLRGALAEAFYLAAHP